MWNKIKHNLRKYQPCLTTWFTLQKGIQERIIDNYLFFLNQLNSKYFILIIMKQWMVLNQALISRTSRINQCASFMHKPKCIQILAIKHIERYLHGTSTDGMIFQPTLIWTLIVVMLIQTMQAYKAMHIIKVQHHKKSTCFYITLRGASIVWVSWLKMRFRWAQWKLNSHSNAWSIASEKSFKRTGS